MFRRLSSKYCRLRDSKLAEGRSVSVDRQKNSPRVDYELRLAHGHAVKKKLSPCKPRTARLIILEPVITGRGTYI